ncbi:Spy/CpxP family protein refolding chaperone [Shewanella algae]
MNISIKASLLALIAGTALMTGVAQAANGYGDCYHRGDYAGYHHMNGDRGYRCDGSARGYHHMNGDRGYRCDGNGYHRMHGDRGYRCDGSARGGYYGMFGLRGLGLTEAQWTKIDALMEQHRSSMVRPDAATRDARRAEMHALVTEARFDEAKAKKLIEQRQQVREQHMLERMKLHNQIYNLLTPEQQAKFKEGPYRCGDCFGPATN